MLAVTHPTQKIVHVSCAWHREGSEMKYLKSSVLQYNTNWIATDDFTGYNIFKKTEGVRHTISKRYTTHIESENSNVRNFLARFTRRSKKTTKCIEMAELELKCYAIMRNKNATNKESFLDLFPYSLRNRQKDPVIV